jgi:hypothetical protein
MAVIPAPVFRGISNPLVLVLKSRMELELGELVPMPICAFKQETVARDSIIIASLFFMTLIFNL